MTGTGREESQNRKWAEIKKKIDDETKIAEELQMEVNQGSQQFKELLTKARDFGKAFDELDNEHAERESMGVSGHVKDNADWEQAKTKLHAVNHSITSYLVQNAAKDEGIELAPFEPKRLKMKEPSFKQKSKEGKSSKRNDQDVKRSDISAASAKSVFPANPSQLKQFLESKDFNFKEKLINLQKETNKAKKEALAEVLIKWLSCADDLAASVRDAR
jgi:hypothetical protein